ncbi:helix-hairpin-helix domain-containing protein [Brachybacterium sp. YJGR34]|uniref:helix-hairpin-helix domain-containing protein n=1 Tax=Brachybacterium sp. YJGR34 TaxID=2059911 RepID=UPI000E0CAB2D|nr:helix-hairpin-helix domain-containing protein [Brachybacterium sp. YJGR34]
MCDLESRIGDVPGVGAPAARALAEQGLRTVGTLAGADWAVLASLHGVGPAAGRRLQAVLTEHGESLRNPPPPRAARASGSTRHTGVTAKDVRTRATDVDPAAYVDSLAGRRRREGAALLALFGEVTGEPATMWGPSMIGFGEYHYVYASGREGDTFRLGFSPRTAEIALYGLQGSPRCEELLARLGPHRRGAGCVWVRSLEAVDLGVLAELVAYSWEHPPGVG